MKKTALLISFFIILAFGCKEIEHVVHVDLSEPAYEFSQPKLVVGITVDQMRFDYLTRYWNDYSDDGFKRLVTDGYFCRNHHFSYAPTYTGPGHASIYTGTTPAYHGIIGNYWYDKVNNSGVYCSADSTVSGVGNNTVAGEMSPKNMLVSTITDELKLFTNQRGKSIGISIKDRGAILPAGHLADAAYWFIGSDEGKFISSTYYMDELPKWVTDFNKSSYRDSLLDSGWDLYADKSVYDESIIDNNQYEAPFNGKLQPAFPYDFSMLKDSNAGFDLVKGSPLGNELVTEFALQCLKNEQLGQDEHCDFLAVSYSSTDYVGHRFAPAALETQDCYLRLDNDISNLLAKLDKQVGKGNYTVFLTADHGAVHNPNYLKKLGASAGYFKTDQVTTRVDSALKRQFGVEGLIQNYSNDQIFLNDSIITSERLDRELVESVTANSALAYEGVYMTITRTQFQNSEFTTGVKALLQAGFSQKLSGDVLVVPRPGWMDYPTTGSSHGSPFTYDTHVPLLFYGRGIQPGFTDSETHIKDIAPTLAALLGIQMPNATTGSPILDVLGQ